MNAIRTVEGDLRVGDLRIALVASRFNEAVVDRLVKGAVDALVTQGANPAGLELVRVPGAYDLPPIARRLADSGRFDAIVALGAVIRARLRTSISSPASAAAGLARVAVETGVPVAFGVLTTENEEQAMARAGGSEGNRGADAALAAIELANLLRKLGG